MWIYVILVGKGKKKGGRYKNKKTETLDSYYFVFQIGKLLL